MKGFRSFCLIVLVLTVAAQFGALYPIGDRQDGEEILMDSGGIGQQNGSVVSITNPGVLKVFLEVDDLDFKVCSMKCNADFLVCYDGNSSSTNNMCGTECGFYVTGKGTKIAVTSSSASRYEEQRKNGECESLKMNNSEMFFRDVSFTSCAPKIENGMVKLNVLKASSDCPVIIKNAFVLPESTSAPSTTTTTAAKIVQNSITSTQFGYGNGTTTEEPATFMSSYWWIFLIIGLVIIGGIVAGFLIYCLIFKKEKKPTIVSPAVKRHLKRPRTKIIEQPPPEEEEENKRSKLPSSILDPSSILSQKSLLYINKEQPQQDLKPMPIQ